MHSGTRILWILASACAAHGADSFTGRVVTGATPLASAKVWLKSRPDLADSTGADGRFELPLTSSALRPLPGEAAGAPGFFRRGNRLEFRLWRNQDNAAGFYDLRGHRWARETGVGQAPGEAASPPLAKRAAGEDTLIVLRMGYEIRKTSVADPAAKDLGDVALKLRSYRRDTAFAVKAGRRIEVYVPSDLRDLQPLPVLYLVHGRAADETYWRVNCKFLDSLNTFADRDKVQPMIIVTPAAGGSENGFYGKTADPFYTDLTVDIRGWVESHYKADTSRWARAISGLSLGAMQTWNLTLFYPGMWGWSLPMSGGLHLSSGFSHAKLKADVAAGIVNVAAINQMKMFKVYTNPTDIAYQDTDTTSRLADTLGMKHTTDFTTKTSGGHTDPYWNEVFRKYSTVIFKE